MVMHACQTSNCMCGVGSFKMSSVTHCSRLGQAHRVVTPEWIATVECLIQENQWLTSSDYCHTSCHQSRFSKPHHPCATVPHSICNVAATAAYTTTETTMC
ncbi:hypothetical protein BsWGS_09382 [Bradybaena similaris]